MQEELLGKQIHLRTSDVGVEAGRWVVFGVRNLIAVLVLLVDIVSTVLDVLNLEFVGPLDANEL